MFGFLAKRDVTMEEGSATSSSAPGPLFCFVFCFDSQLGSAEMPEAGLRGDGGGYRESDISIKRGQDVFQPDVGLQDGCFLFLGA